MVKTRHLREVVVLGVDADEVDGTQVEAVVHVQADLLEPPVPLGHRKPVLVVSEVPRIGGQFLNFWLTVHFSQKKSWFRTLDH